MATVSILRLANQSPCLTDKEHLNAVKTIANYLPVKTPLCVMFKDTCDHLNTKALSP